VWHSVTHREKVDRAVSELGAEGFSQHTIAPPIFRMFWKIGINIPPPFFIDFWSLALLEGALFGAAMAIYYSVFHKSSHLIVCAIGGAVFGLTVSGIARRKARGLCLPSWKSYGKSN
jgi:hypothetical protein